MFQQGEHIGIIVSDLERSMDFYGRILGLEQVARRSLEGGTELAFYRLGDMEIELIAGASLNGEGDSVVNHVAFRVNDIDEAVAHLRSHGVKLDNEEPIDIWDGGKILFFRGPDNERLELFQHGNS